MEDQTKDQFLIMKKTDFVAFTEELLSQFAPKEPNKWILEEEAMKLLGIKSKSHLWKLRSEGCITYTQPSRKILLYDRDSILNHLNAHIKKSF